MESTFEIKYPSEIIYYIAYTDTMIFVYGIVETTQEMTTGQPHLYTTTNKQEWIDKLINEFNTNPITD